MKKYAVEYFEKVTTLYNLHKVLLSCKKKKKKKFPWRAILFIFLLINWMEIRIVSLENNTRNELKLILFKYFSNFNIENKRK